MGFFRIIKSILAAAGKTSGFSVEGFSAPSREFATQVEVIAYVMGKTPEHGWASFVPCSEHRTIIQATPDSINTCTEKVDAAAIARRIGVTALAEVIEEEQIRTGDPTMHVIKNTSPHEMAEIIHGIFVHHYGFPPDYRLECWIES
jgi:hypothetical protein